jgi:hypothetical protein
VAATGAERNIPGLAQLLAELANVEVDRQNRVNLMLTSAWWQRLVMVSTRLSLVGLARAGRALGSCWCSVARGRATFVHGRRGSSPIQLPSILSEVTSSKSQITTIYYHHPLTYINKPINPLMGWRQWRRSPQVAGTAGGRLAFSPTAAFGSTDAGAGRAAGPVARTLVAGAAARRPVIACGWRRWVVSGDRVH